MAAPRGTKPPNMGKGRKKGTPNKATADVRVIIAKVAEANAPKIAGWLVRIGRTNPAKAMDLYLRMLEYHIPKLTRTEIVKPQPNGGRVIDSSKLTAEEREQMRQIILRQMQQPAAIEHQAPNVLEPDSVEEHGSTSELSQ